MASTCKCVQNKKQNEEVHIKNPHIVQMKKDYLYHITLDTETYNLIEAFGDTKFVCMGGTAKRMEAFAEYILKEINHKLPFGTKLKNLSASGDRYALYKIGPVIAVSHGMGCPSISILLHEMIKLMYHAKCKDPVFIRIGTCGGIGYEGGTVIITEDACDERLDKNYTIPILGKPVSRPSVLDKDICNELKSLTLPEDGFKIISGTTMCAQDFYEGQGRVDGAFCNYTEEDKINYLHCLRCNGIVNIEMESTAFAALTKGAGIRASIVCVSILNRLKEDQVTTSPKLLTEWQARPQMLVARYIKKQLEIK